MPEPGRGAQARRRPRPAGEGGAPVSGLYLWSGRTDALQAESPHAVNVALDGDGASRVTPAAPSPTAASRALAASGASAELRLDIDGRYPQMLASGVVRRASTSDVNWVASVTPGTPNELAGPIIFRDPAAPTAFPYVEVRIRVIADAGPDRPSATVSFIGPGDALVTLRFGFAAPYFHAVDVEVATVAGDAPTLSISTCAHPNRPATLRCETLSVQNVFERAGVQVTMSASGTVPLSGAGPDAAWSKQELHDAMQVFWSHASAGPQWALWVLIAAMSVDGPRLGGLMFDDIGVAQRQGCAIFRDSFIAHAPPGDPSPGAWVERMRFWAACHEIGHCFNLAHSWQKPRRTPWMPQADDELARSFMNYPGRVPGGESAFFGDFAHRFSDDELAFVRHAPSRFVQMGNVAWFDEHAFADVGSPAGAGLRLELRANRDRPLFEFMEPPRLELKLTNVSPEPQIIDRHVLELGDALTVVIKRAGQPAYLLQPYVRRCWPPDGVALAPGDALYAPLAAASGSRGWTIDEPGLYIVQAALELAHERVVSEPIELLVARPRGDETHVSEQYFTADVGRVLGLQGSRVLTRANDTLQELVERLGDIRAALHARLALGNALGSDHKTLVADKDSPVGFVVVAHRGDVDTGRELMRSALLERPDTAVETFGHVGYKTRVDAFSEWLADHDAADEARASQRTLYDALSHHTVSGRGVRREVLAEVRRRHEHYRDGRRSGRT